MSQKVLPKVYLIWISGIRRTASTQTEALKMVFEHCAKVNPAVVEFLAKHPVRKVKIIAQNWRDLNPGKEYLAERHTRVFGNYWIYNTRSGDKVLELMDRACWKAGIKFMEDIKVDTSAFKVKHYQTKTYFDSEIYL